MENYKELEEMRQQMAILKNKLESQTIVNDRMLRRAMKDSLNWINRTYIWQIVITLFVALPYCWWSLRFIGTSVEFTVVTMLFLLYAVCYTVWTGLPLRDKLLMQGELLQVSEIVARAKKRDGDWLLQGIPFLLIWVGWFAYEMYNKHGYHHQLLISCIIGALIGGAIGLSIHLKTQRKYREILERIEEMREV
jgi:hypothetical protein